jgi:16S rRNA (cytosine967-C5)-methyltransferase
LWRTLAPGGTMLYATCSLFAEENADQVAAFVARHSDALRLPTYNEKDEWQLTPDADQDGFFYARLAKR